MVSPRKFQSICVFCASSSGKNPVYAEAAAHLGRVLAQRGLRTVYGGAHVGLMGTLADAALSAGGHVSGVIPQSLIDREIGHTGITEMHIVQSMHERKALMAELGDGFIALPGAWGTLDEFCEILTWAQLGIHAKPCGILNVLGYYDPLLQMFSRAIEQGFLKPAYRDMVLVDSDSERLLSRMEQAPAVSMAKWIVPAEASPVP